VSKDTRKRRTTDQKSRRAFLRTGLAAGAVVLSSRPLPAAAQRKTNLTYISYELTSATAGPGLKRQIADFEKASPTIGVEAIPTPRAPSRSSSCTGNRVRWGPVTAARPRCVSLGLDHGICERTRDEWISRKRD